MTRRPGYGQVFLPGWSPAPAAAPPFVPDVAGSPIPAPASAAADPSPPTSPIAGETIAQRTLRPPTLSADRRDRQERAQAALIARVAAWTPSELTR